jgi:hypothetical protein
VTTGVVSEFERRSIAPSWCSKSRPLCTHVDPALLRNAASNLRAIEARVRGDFVVARMPFISRNRGMRSVTTKAFAMLGASWIPVRFLLVIWESKPKIFPS